MLNKGDYLCTVDIASAYQSVSIRPEHWKYMGLLWRIGDCDYLFINMRLCFRQKCPPYNFSSFWNFAVDCMKARGFSPIFCYLDDFIMVGDSFESCENVQVTLISLLGDLGFMVNWSKCTSLFTTHTYLRIEINSDVMQISLPQKKRGKLHSEIQFFENQSRASKKQIQRLIGLLCHCSEV